MKEKPLIHMGAPPPRKSGEHPAVKNLEHMNQELQKSEALLEEQSERLNQAISDAPTPMPPILESDWIITIRGRGPHHNASAEDANRLATKFVIELRDAGHAIVDATFRNGAEESVKEK